VREQTRCSRGLNLFGAGRARMLSRHFELCSMLMLDRLVPWHGDRLVLNAHVGFCWLSSSASLGKKRTVRAKYCNGEIVMMWRLCTLVEVGTLFHFLKKKQLQYRVMRE
jgi:hypothetical protein